MKSIRKTDYNINEKGLFITLMTIVIPIAIQNLLVTIVNASDALMLGVISDKALSAANLAGQMMAIYNCFLVALCVGTTVLAAQYWGDKNTSAIEAVLGITLQISMAVAIIIGVLCLAIPEILMTIFTDEKDLIELGGTYLRWVSGAYIFMGFSQVYMIIMKNTGRVKRSAIYGAIAVGLNIVLNALLIFGLFGLPKMGVAGAAFATTISRGVEFMLTFVESRKSEEVRFRVIDMMKVHRGIRGKYWRYTLPNTIQTMSWRFATSATVAILGHMGNDVVAANAVCIIVVEIMEAVAMAYASASGIIIGQSLGKGELEDAKKNGDKLLKMSCEVGLALTVIMCAISPFVVKIATSLSDQARYYLQWILIVMAVKMIGKLVNNTLSNGIFVAGGDVHFIMKVDIINMWCVIVPLGFLAAFVFKLPVIPVFIVMNMDEYTKMYMVIKHYKKYIWVKNLTKKEWAKPSRFQKLIKDDIIDNMPIGIMLIGSSGKITMTNDNTTDILGISNEDIEGENFAKLFIEDERNNDFAQAILDSLDNKQVIVDKLVSYQRGEVEKLIQIRSSFIEEDDTNVGILVMLNNLTKWVDKRNVL